MTADLSTYVTLSYAAAGVILGGVSMYVAWRHHAARRLLAQLESGADEAQA